MFTKHNKVKELAVYFAKTPDISCLVSINKKYEPIGVATVKSYEYEVNGIKILYDKWFVEAFESAKQMDLPGCEHHNKLVKGSGVLVSTHKFGNTVFYGKDAQDIIDAYEYSSNSPLYTFEKQR